MRRFSFNLEKVLELRKFDEREWELKLAEVTGRVVGVENELEEWGRRRNASVELRVHPGRVDMALLRSRDDYVNLIDDRVRQLQRRLVTLETEREKVRTRYLEVSRRRKALSRLEERQRDRYYRNALKDETRSLDEIAGSMTARKLSRAEEDNVR